MAEGNWSGLGAIKYCLPPHTLTATHSHTHTYTRGRRTPMLAYIDLDESYKVKVICNYILDTFLIG